MKTIINAAVVYLLETDDGYSCNVFYSDTPEAGPIAIIYMMESNAIASEEAVTLLNANFPLLRFELQNGIDVITVWPLDI